MENQQNQNTRHGLSLSKQDWLTLSFIQGVGPARLDRLFVYLQTLEADSEGSHDMDIMAVSGYISYEVLIQLKWPKETSVDAMAFLKQGFISSDVSKKLSLTLSWLNESPLHHLIMRNEADYPFELAQINVAPLLLYVQGSLTGLHQPKLAIVGARKATQYGLDIAFNFALQLSQQGISLVSGGAIGIDTAAHKGSLEQVGSSIAVMGTGLLNLYPKTNKGLFDSIIESNGCLISEYPLQTQVQARLFPARNRIISGLSLGVIVVEAGFKSGSLISANYALQHNREVFAVPGRISDKASVACLDLIKQGAKLITQVEDVLSEFPQLSKPSSLTPSIPDLNFSNREDVYPDQKSPHQVAVSRETQIENKLIPQPFVADNLNQNEILILSVIDETLSDVSSSNVFELNQLVKETELSIGEVMQACMQLELDDLLDPLMTGYARRLMAKKE
jgi:DNA processing protein